MTSRKKGRIGSSFDDFLKDEGVYNEVETVAVKRVIAWQLEEAMKARRMSKLQMARRMKTSRSQLDRLLDPSHSGVTLETLARAAQVLGRHIRVELFLIIGPMGSGWAKMTAFCCNAFSLFAAGSNDRRCILSYRILKVNEDA